MVRLPARALALCGVVVQESAEYQELQTRPRPQGMRTNTAAAPPTPWLAPSCSEMPFRAAGGRDSQAGRLLLRERASIAGLGFGLGMQSQSQELQDAECIMIELVYNNKLRVGEAHLIFGRASWLARWMQMGSRTFQLTSSREIDAMLIHAWQNQGQFERGKLGLPDERKKLGVARVDPLPGALGGAVPPSESHRHRKQVPQARHGMLKVCRTEGVPCCILCSGDKGP